MVDYQPKTSVRNLSMLLQKVTVLVLDPDARISNIIKHVLLNLGFGTIEIVHSREEAIDKVKEVSVDFIIADVDVKPVEGEQSFIEFVRTSPESPNPYVPIIMLTGHTDQQEVEMARDLGISEFAAKPFTAKSLCDRIVRIIENPRSFIITKRYSGPDRRRRAGAPPGTADRRGSDREEKNKSSLFERILGKKQ